MNINIEGHKLEQEYLRITDILSSPDIMKDPIRLKDNSRLLKELDPKIKIFRAYKKVINEIEKLKKLLTKEKDSDMVGLIDEELKGLEERKVSLENQWDKLLNPVSKEEQGNVIMEIRAGTGGDEAALFARDLFKMYSKFAEKKEWKIEVMDSSISERGGFKEVIYVIEGEGVWSQLKYESGVHRVQRVPETETMGRIHTSTATVAVLPEVGEVDVKINPGDLDIGTFRASGPGGQHVNKTSSAIRIVHKPSGIRVQCQDQKSQHQNKEKALRVLKAKLIKFYTEKQTEEICEQRKSQIKGGERSDKIRTYNFPQARITDHRINTTFHRLKDVLDGKLEILTQVLKENLEEK
ncbi:MAG: peptide chain release factor 1 [Candidatus Omnitrophota bacterium]